MSLRLHCLGGARLERDSSPVGQKAAQRRRFALLVLLLRASRRTLTRERILAYLWPDHAPDAARRLLSESVYVIRRELGDSVIQSVGEELTLGDSVESDVDDFLSAVRAGEHARAVDLYRGPFLDGWFMRDAPEFEPWIETERVELSRMYVNALRGLAEQRESVGEWLAAAEGWQTILRTDPYSSTCTLRAARALASAGEAAPALQLICAHEALLREELGVGLDNDLAALAEAIRNGTVRPRRGEHFADRQENSLNRLPADREQTSANSPTGEAHLSDPSKFGRFAKFRWAVGVAAIILGTLAGWVLIRRAQLPDEALHRRGEPALDPRRIAVLYFDDLSPDRSLGYIADGLAEELIRELADVPTLHVLSRAAAAHYRGAQISPDSIGRTLRAGTIINAALQESQGQIRVTARLVDPVSREQVATVQVEQPRGELFALEDSLAAHMAAALRQRLGDAVRLRDVRNDRHGRRDNRALALVMRAERLRKEAEAARTGLQPSVQQIDDARRQLQLADSLLNAAEGMDPTWAEVALERGWVAVETGRLEHGTARVVALAPALGYAERALAILTELVPFDSTARGEALYLRGLARTQMATAVQTYRAEGTSLKRGRADLDSAVALNAHNAGAWAAMSMSRYIDGDFEGAQRAAGRAIEEDAFLEEGSQVIGWAWRAAYAKVDRAGALRWCRRGRELFPNDWHFIECELTVMRLDAAQLTGIQADPNRAWVLVKQLERIDPPSRAIQSGRPYSPVYRRLAAAAVSAAAGQLDSARAVLSAELTRVRKDPELSTDILYDAAFLELVLGDRDRARTMIDEYIRARPDLARMLTKDPTIQRALGSSHPGTPRALSGEKIFQ